MRSSTQRSSSPRSISASSSRIASSDADVAGFLGTMSQYSPTTFERSKVPIRRAAAMISSLLKPTSGRRIVSPVAWEITARFCRVCDETWPTAFARHDGDRPPLPCDALGAAQHQALEQDLPVAGAGARLELLDHGTELDGVKARSIPVGPAVGEDLRHPQRSQLMGRAAEVAEDVVEGRPRAAACATLRRRSRSHRRRAPPPVPRRPAAGRPGPRCVPRRRTPLRQRSRGATVTSGWSRSTPAETGSSAAPSSRMTSRERTSPSWRLPTRRARTAKRLPLTCSRKSSSPCSTIVARSPAAPPLRERDRLDAEDAGQRAGVRPRRKPGEDAVVGDLDPRLDSLGFERVSQVVQQSAGELIAGRTRLGAELAGEAQDRELRSRFVGHGFAGPRPAQEPPVQAR